MIARRLALLLLLGGALAAAPALAIGGGAPVSSPGSSGTIATSGQTGGEFAAPAAQAPQGSESCERSLRSFMGRNTMSPSQRREALRRCQERDDAERAASVSP